MIHKPEQSFAADRLGPLVVSFGSKARILKGLMAIQRSAAQAVVRVEVRFRYWADAADRRWREARMGAHVKRRMRVEAFEVAYGNKELHSSAREEGQRRSSSTR